MATSHQEIAGIAQIALGQCGTGKENEVLIRGIDATMGCFDGAFTRVELTSCYARHVSDDLAEELVSAAVGLGDRPAQGNQPRGQCGGALIERQPPARRWVTRAIGWAVATEPRRST